MELMQGNGMPYGNQYPPQFPPFPPGMPPNMMPNMPPGMPPNMPPGMPPNMQHGMPPNMPPNMQAGMVPNMGGMPSNMTLAMQGGMPPNMPSGIHPNMQSGMPMNMPSGMPPNMPSGMPYNMPSGMPPNMPSSQPSSMPSELPPSLPSGLPPSIASGQPPMPGQALGSVPGLAPSAPPPPPSADFLPTPVYDLQQTGEVHAGPGGRAAGAGSGLVAAAGRLGADEADAVARAKKFAMEQSIKMVLMKQTLAHQQQQMASQRTQVQRQQALALMCRVYVGSISFELKEDTIRLAFLPFGPIKSINMSWDPVTQKHKGFAFVEYEIPEAAQLSLEQMNGVMLGGRNIKVVGRPSNMPQAQAVIDEIQEEAKRYNRIYVASIHPELSEDDIKNVFEAFGVVSYCRLAGGGSTSSRHKGYGFIEYERLDSCLEAIQSMNLFDLGGQYLRVGRAITPPEALRGAASASAPLPAAAAVAAAAATAKIQAIDAVATLQLSKLSALGALPLAGVAAVGGLPGVAGVLPPPQVVIPPPPTQLAPSTQAPPSPAAQSALQQKLLDNEPDTLQHQESLSISGQSARHLVMQKLLGGMRRTASSRCVVLRGMVVPEEVDEALHHEIRDECALHGDVTRLVIYTEPDLPQPHVKVFVQFRTNEEANTCVAALDGRYFGGRRVCAQLYDQALFDCSDLTH